MKKALVTGATGFIGQYVVEQLLANGYEVIATSAGAEKAASMAWFNRVQYVPFRLEEFDPAVDYFRYFGQPDLLVHLAWEGLPNYKSLFHFEDNLPRHYQLLKNLVTNGLKDITITGTCFEYGMQTGALKESDDARPDNPYALAKDTLRKFMTELQKQQPFTFRWVRLFYMYGKGQHPKSLLSQLERALEEGKASFEMSGGMQVRDYLPVTTVAEYIVKIAGQWAVTGIINCCSGEPVTVKQLVLDYLASANKHIELVLGHYPYPDYEPMEFWGESTKLKTILNNE
ncbi:NAD(P)-dependent oxidoreductase [Chitinophaga sedimenti]|uniref:NAD-dependent epimerase/dehydratase family protein n=1 Tax=Chitinophaga sedimenti TaxID=2033606 RepID=UPI0020067374|nr:NAD(P)-dependent oxidoreductase [Chitinophaga sedimenti]MCK7555869.1 NAD(P)-dependent oxidoreductase [Chitinophaga sedimenti]